MMKYSTIRSFHVSLDLNLDRGTERNTNVFLGCLISLNTHSSFLGCIGELSLTCFRIPKTSRYRFVVMSSLDIIHPGPANIPHVHWIVFDSVVRVLFVDC